MRLIEGGQELAAIDRINQLLAKTPNAAWLLAIKGELSLGMQEIESFKETANRFLKLQPDNPLALIMKSMVSSFDNEPLENAARYLLQGMSEARESLPALTLAAIRVLIRSLAASGKMSLVGYWSDVLNALTSEDGPEDDSALLDANLNLITKAPARLMEDPPGAEWKERLAEVLSLARTFRYAQAETKLRAILRDFPDQPGPLSHLLRAQCAQLDQNGAFATARKLAEHLDVPADDRAYFAAVALELEPEHKSIQADMVIRYCEIDSEDRVVEALGNLDFVEHSEGQGIEQVRQYYAALVLDEVPAKRIYSVFDRTLTPGADQTESDVPEIASSAGTVVIYGKQTDKPSRVLFLANRFPAYESLLEGLLDALQLGEEVSDVEIPQAGDYTEFLRRPKVIIGGQRQALSIEQQGQELIEDFLNLPQKTLDGQSPLEAAGDERKRSNLLGLLNHLEGEQSLVVEASVLDEIYSRLGLKRPTVEVGGDSESLRIVNILDLDRIDITRVNDQQLKGLMVRSMSLGATRVFYRCAQAVRECSGLADDTQLQVAALSGLLSIAPSLDDKIAYCGELETALAKAKAPVGRVVIQHMSLLHAAGRPEEAQQVLLEGTQKYPEDPHLMSFLQYALQSQQGGGGMAAAPGDDLAMRMMQNASRPASAQNAESGGDSGLVLPGQQPGSSDGESKLWLPGS